MSNIWSKLFGSSDESKTVAKSRLHFVLVQDRSGLQVEDLNAFKAEMVAVIEKYFTIKTEDIEISYQRENETTTLMINSPVELRRLQAKRENDKKKGKEIPPAISEAIA